MAEQKTSTPKPKVFYFDARGRAEIIRLVLTLARKEFDDVRFNKDDWPKFKEDAPFGQAPYAEINGKRYGQSMAIARFHARENGLYGKTNLDQLREDEVIELVNDLAQVLLKLFLESDEAKKAKLKQTIKDDDAPKFCSCFERLLKENGSHGVFVGKELTLADLAVFNILESVVKMLGLELSVKFPGLQTLMDKVRDHPDLKKYLTDRKETPM